MTTFIATDFTYYPKYCDEIAFYMLEEDERNFRVEKVRLSNLTEFYKNHEFVRETGHEEIRTVWKKKNLQS